MLGTPLGTYEFCKKNINIEIKQLTKLKWWTQYNSIGQTKPDNKRKNCYSGQFSLTKKC